MADEASAIDTPTEATDAPQEAVSTPPWERDGQPFDPERAWARIEAQRADMDALRAERDQHKAKVTEYEDAALTAEQRAQRDAEAIANEHSNLTLENARLKAIIANPGLSDEDIELIGGSSPEEIADKAAKLAARLGAGTPPNPLATRPSEALRGGADPTTPAEGASDDWLRTALAKSNQ